MNWVKSKLASGASVVSAIKGKASESSDAVKRSYDDASIAMQSKLNDAMQGAFQAVIDEKRKAPSVVSNGNVEEDVRNQINLCARNNGMISGGAALIPGPMGMVSIVPEIALVFRNQIGLVYDIGRLHGKEEVLDRDLLMGVILTAMGSGATAVLVMHGGRVLVKRSSLRVFQRLMAVLAGRITQKALKATISRWLPVVGAAFMAWFSHHMTKRIGRKADEIMRQEIVWSTEELSVDEIEDVEVELAQAEGEEDFADDLPEEGNETAPPTGIPS